MKKAYGSQNGVDKPVRKQSGVGVEYDAPFRGYINLSLSDEQKSTFPAWAQSQAWWEALAFNVSDGVNLSLKIDPKSEGFIASATQRRSSSPNAGLVVTARGKDPETALGRVLFTLTILNKKDRWEETQPLANPDRW